MSLTSPGFGGGELNDFSMSSKHSAVSSVNFNHASSARGVTVHSGGGLHWPWTDAVCILYLIPINTALNSQVT